MYLHLTLTDIGVFWCQFEKKIRWKNLGTQKKGFLGAEIHRIKTRDGRGFSRDRAGWQLAQKAAFGKGGKGADLVRSTREGGRREYS